MPTKAEVFAKAAPLLAEAVRDVRTAPFRAVASGLVAERWCVMDDLNAELVHKPGGGVRYWKSVDDATAAANRMNREWKVATPGGPGVAEGAGAVHDSPASAPVLSGGDAA